LAYATWELTLITPTAIQTAAIYRFGSFELDENNLSFSRAGEEVLLAIKPWSTLLLLAQQAPDTHRREILRTIEGAQLLYRAVECSKDEHALLDKR
jgi:DNA-binding response OmpR family regulator